MKNRPSKPSSKFTFAASYGVALATSFVSIDLSADIVDLTWNGGNASATAPFTQGSSGVLHSQDIDQVPNVTFSTPLCACFSFPDFRQWNDNYDDGVGRTMALTTVADFGSVTESGGPMSMAVISPGDVLDPNTFVGALNKLGVPTSIGATEFDGTGSAFIAIRPRSAPGNLYWFKIELPVVGGPLVYSEGQYGNEGETLVAGGTDAWPCVNRLGDINGDAAIDLLDVSPFIDALVFGLFVCEADINQDDSIDLMDVDPFVALLLGE